MLAGDSRNLDAVSGRYATEDAMSALPAGNVGVCAEAAGLVATLHRAHDVRALEQGTWPEGCFRCRCHLPLLADTPF